MASVCAEEQKERGKSNVVGVTLDMQALWVPLQDFFLHKATQQPDLLHRFAHCTIKWIRPFAWLHPKRRNVIYEIMPRIMARDLPYWHWFNSCLATLLHSLQLYIPFRLCYDNHLCIRSEYITSTQLVQYSCVDVIYSHCIHVCSAFFLGGRRGTRTPKHFVNLTAGSKNFKILELRVPLNIF
jgi:hypothetical protein